MSEGQYQSPGAFDGAHGDTQWETLYEATGELPVGYDPSTYYTSQEYQQPTQQQLQQYAQVWEAAQEEDDDEDDPEDDDELPPPPPPSDDSEQPPQLPALPPVLLPDAVSHGRTSNPSLQQPPPAANSGMKVEGRLFVRSSEGLAWPGWQPCHLSLSGDILTYKTENGAHTGILEISKLKSVGLKNIKDVPEGKNAFALYIGVPKDIKYSFYADDDTQYFVWLGIFQNFKKKAKSGLKKSSGGSSSGSGKKIRRSSSKKMKRTGVGSSAVVDIAKQRLGEYGKDVNRPTYRFLQLLYSAQPTFINAIFAITQQADADKVAGYLARIFFFVDRAHYLIKNVTNFEVMVTQEQNTLFRSNSLASKIMTAYSRIVAQNYLNYLLKPIIDRVISLGRKLEVQPDKLHEIERAYLPEHREHVKTVVQETLERIKGSIDQLPLECRQICRDLKEEVARKYPNAVDISIAGYLFLRLINPALVVPDSIGIVPSNSLTADNRRGLLVVSKILLNIANCVEFKKEEYMQEFNEWTRSRFDVMRSFYRECAEIPTAGPAKHEIKVEPLTFLEEVARLYKILYFNSEKLMAQLGPDSKLAKEFKSCIDGIGPPDATNNPPPQMLAAPTAAETAAIRGRASVSVANSEQTKRASMFSRLAEAITHFFKPTAEDAEAKAAQTPEKRASFNV